MRKGASSYRIFPVVPAARAVLAAALACGGAPATADTVPVRFPEGLVHGFLALRTANGTTIANGHLLQVTRGDVVTSRVVFRFKDGSIQDETTVFTQDGVFRLVSSKLVQKGPVFPRPVELTIDARTGQVKVRYENDHGGEVVESEKLELPEDLSNGMIFTLLKNLRPDAPRLRLSLLVATPKPRLLRLEIEPFAREGFSLGGSREEATRYVVKARLRGLTGAFASLLNKQPPDSYVWILHGEAPAFVMSESPFYENGPMWRIELASPTWPQVEQASSD
jgi:hypothetical protein